MKHSYLFNVATVLIFIVLISTPLFYLKQSVYPHIFFKTLFFQFAVEILFVVWLALAISDARYRPKKTPLLLAGVGFIGILILTSLFGADFHRSFWSTYERMLGVFTILHLAGFALVIWDKDNFSTAYVTANELSKIPTIVVGDFVRNRLLAETIERWTREGLEDS